MDSIELIRKEAGIGAVIETESILRYILQTSDSGIQLVKFLEVYGKMMDVCGIWS